MHELRFLLLFCASALVACNVAEVPPPPSAIALNTCEDDGQCGSGRCSGGACVARTTTISELLLEVSSVPDAQGASGGVFYKSLVLPRATGGALDIELDPVARLTGHVDVASGSCNPEPPVDDAPSYLVGSTIPVTVTFTPTERVLGIPASSYVANSSLVAPTTTRAEQHEFRVNLPPGEYDIYVNPKPGVAGCVLPPFLALDQAVRGGGDFDINLPAPSPLTVNVVWSDDSLVGWSVDVLDLETGRAISTASPLSVGTPESTNELETSYRYQTTVLYSPPRVPAQAKDESSPDASGEEPPPSPERAQIVRLSPPAEGPVAARVLAQRIGNTGEIRQVSPVPGSVQVLGQTSVAGRPVPVAAQVTFTALELAGFDPGVFATFTARTEVGPDGQFAVDLLPGRYQVDAIPAWDSAACAELQATDAAPCLAWSRAEWTIATGTPVQAGKVLEFRETLVVRGEAFALDRPATGAAVRAIVSPVSLQTDVLRNTWGVREETPRASGSLVRDDGSFLFRADPGTYDFFVQPDPASNFGWYVRPSLAISADSENGERDLMRFGLPLPVAYRGSVLVKGGSDGETPAPMAGALIRAYTYADPNTRDAVIQIAEARAGADGGFQLLVPERFIPARPENSP